MEYSPPDLENHINTIYWALWTSPKHNCLTERTQKVCVCVYIYICVCVCVVVCLSLTLIHIQPELINSFEVRIDSLGEEEPQLYCIVCASAEKKKEWVTHLKDTIKLARNSQGVCVVCCLLLSVCV